MGRMEKPNLLRNTRVYLSGPMDFVASREVEKKFGWRNRVSDRVNWLHGQQRIAGTRFLCRLCLRGFWF